MRTCKKTPRASFPLTPLTSTTTTQSTTGSNPPTRRTTPSQSRRTRKNPCLPRSALSWTPMEVLQRSRTPRSCSGTLSSRAWDPISCSSRTMMPYWLPRTTLTMSRRRRPRGSTRCQSSPMTMMIAALSRCCRMMKAIFLFRIPKESLCHMSFLINLRMSPWID